MNIGILNNNKDVAYSSFEVFYTNIMECLIQLGHSVFNFNSENELDEFLKKNFLDFTISIGKYSFYKNGVPFYKYYDIPHFSWVVDNPIKIGVDLCSENIYYMFIDKEFGKVYDDLKTEKYSFLPLGTEVKEKSSNINKDLDILFTGQIKDSNKIYNEIKQLDLNNQIAINKIIDYMINNLQQSFIQTFCTIKNNFHIQHRDMEIIFRYSNSFIRAYKRKKVINSIRERKITIYGKVEDSDLLRNQNVELKGNIPYDELYKVFNRSKVSLNITPNFSYSCHDRIINSIAMGTCCITDKNNYIDTKFRDMESIVFYDYDNLELLDEKVNNVIETGLYYKIQEEGYKVVKNNFTWQVISKNLLDFVSEKLEGAKYGRNDI